jgi:hypothetical protein
LQMMYLLNLFKKTGIIYKRFKARRNYGT